MSKLKLWRRRLEPTFVLSELRRIGGKIARKLNDPYGQVIHLPAEEEKRGDALVSFWIDPFLLKDGAPMPHSHTAFWESYQIARTWSDLGYETDVIHWTNSDFVPQKSYDVLVDVRLNLERIGPLLADDCLKIQHIETGHYIFHNQAQNERLDALARRRGVRIRPQKLIEVNHAIDHAHAGITAGNEFTISTYAHAGKPIERVSLSAACSFPSPEKKDLEACRRRFLWFGSGGLVHKGLDLVLEAFAGLPEYELVVCGPVVNRERDFEEEYARELYDTPNIHSEGWVDIASPRFQKITDSCLGLAYPSCSEAGGGSVITCLHAGVIPLITWETSVDVHDFGVLLQEASVEAVQEAIREVAEMSTGELRDRAMAAWKHARTHHTRDSFAREYRAAAEKILATHTARGS